MPRLVFPNGEDRLIYQTGLSPGSALLNVNGVKFNVYLDEACTALADILNADGTPNAGSQITVDTQSNIPLFQGPVDGTDVLFLRVDQTNGPGYRIHARYDDRLDGKLGTLEIAADSNKLGGVSAPLYQTTAQANAAYVERAGVQSATVATTESTTSASFTDLTTVGPSVTATIGASGVALVLVRSVMSNSTGGFGGIVTVQGTNVTADLSRILQIMSAAAGAENSASAHFLLTGLPAGSQSFKLQYRQAGGGTATFKNRSITVIPL